MRTLLDRAFEPRWKEVDVDSLRVSDMNDGGMGSLLFDTTKPARMFGRALSEGWFKDEDGFRCWLPSTSMRKMRSSNSTAGKLTPRPDADCPIPRRRYFPIHPSWIS